MKYLWLPFFYVVLCLCELSGQAATRPLAVSESGTHLIYADDASPFFYLADTAWELLHRLDLRESKHYLQQRAKDGFNVIQCVFLAELEGIRTPNRNGDFALIDGDPTRINPAYLEQVDAVLAEAERLGLYLGLLPTWGDKFNLKWGVGPEIFTPENAEIFGRLLAEHYRGRNIIWILGGDRNPEEEEDFEIIRSMATGIRAVIGQEQLITYHPQGGYCSLDFWAADEWLDFHMFQSGHGKTNDKANYDQVVRARREAPNQPVINGEPAYEDHPINWRSVNGWFDDWDTRQAAYWSVFSGAAGHTFGNHNIWQMWHFRHQPISQARTPWDAALQYPGAQQMGYLRQLMERMNYPSLQPCNNCLADPANSSGRETFAMRSRPGTAPRLLVYTPYGDPITIALDQFLEGEAVQLKSYWFNPRTGATIPFAYENYYQGDGLSLTADPPFAAARGNDWVLYFTTQAD
ncbi:MAG: DUF4038 domain-containing protein [Bacteroidota bacterium]